MRCSTIFTIFSVAAATLGFAAPALAGPTYVFGDSVGLQPSDVATITLTQVDGDSVKIDFEFGAAYLGTYGFINSGGPHTPFAFNLLGTGALSISSWAAPTNGQFLVGMSLEQFTLDTGGGGATPYGSFGIALDDSAGNGTSDAYKGDLTFTLYRSTGLSTDDFTSNGPNGTGYYFAADLTNGRSTTGSQAWSDRVDPPSSVPEPMTLSLFGAGIVGAVSLRRRRKA